MEEDMSVDWHSNAEVIQSKISVSGKKMHGKSNEENTSSSSLSGNQTKKLHGSRLDVMKRQFNKKISRRGLPIPQKLVGPTASEKLTSNSHSASNVSTIV